MGQFKLTHYQAACLIGEAAYSFGEATFPLGEATFLLGKATFLLGKATFPLGKVTFPLGKATFPLGKATFPLGKATFPLGKATFPLGKATFPLGKAAFPLGKATFPLGKATFPLGEATFPLGKATFPLGKAAFPLGKAAFPLGKAAFPLGKATFPLGEATHLLGEATFCRKRDDLRVSAGSLVVQARVPPDGYQPRRRSSAPVHLLNREGRDFVAPQTTNFPPRARPLDAARRTTRPRAGTDETLRLATLGWGTDLLGWLLVCAGMASTALDTSRTLNSANRRLIAARPCRSVSATPSVQAPCLADSCLLAPRVYYTRLHETHH